MKSLLENLGLQIIFVGSIPLALLVGQVVDFGFSGVWGLVELLVIYLIIVGLLIALLRAVLPRRAETTKDEASDD